VDLSRTTALVAAAGAAALAVLTAAIWMTDAFGVMLGAYGLHLHFSFTVAMLLLTGMGLGSALPSTPGSAGTQPWRTSWWRRHRPTW
jgi:uncharacterized membrane protein YbhN (UPF0104 family)